MSTASRSDPIASARLIAELNYRIYIKWVSFDPAKRKANLRKHAIDLAECDAIFDAPMVTREDARHDYGEERLISLGLLHGRVVVLVWTDRDEGPRMISCREANAHEQEAYFRICRSLG